jgi:type IV secretion system protein VirD4
MSLDDIKYGKYLTSELGARWADIEEIKESTTLTKINVSDDIYPGAGLPLISSPDHVWVDSSDTHSIVLGSTGSKKTRLFAMPLLNILATGGESFIATDPKGELFAKTSGLVKSKGYKTLVLNLRDLEKSDFWNPLALPYILYHGLHLGSSKSKKVGIRRKKDREVAISMMNDIITALAESQKRNTNDSYFIELASAQALANMLFFIETATIEEAHLYNFANFFANTCDPEETDRIASYCEDGSIADINYKTILTNRKAERTFGNVSSCVSNMLRPFMLQKSLCQVLSKSSFDIRDLYSEKTALYLIVPDEKTTRHFICTMFIKQVYEVLVNEASQRDQQMLPIRVNYVLDEFCNIPKVPDMACMISAARSRNMRFFLMVQSLYQLNEKYKDDAHTIKGNCDNWVFLTSREYALLEEISMLCGNRIYKDANGQLMSHALITTSDLQQFRKDMGEALVRHSRNHPFVAFFTDIDDYNFPKFSSQKMKDNALPKLVRYNVNKVISDIKTKKRPIPFSDEVHGEYRYLDTIKQKSKSDLFDW